MRRKIDVVERIRTDIVDGVFEHGERLGINRLAERYQTSHTPVREALRELAGDGILHFEPNKGAMVRTLDGEFIVDLMDMRASIEASLARRSAERATQADICTLNEIEARFEEQIEAGNYDAALSINHEFHNKLNAIAGNSDAASLVSRNWVLLAALWRRYGYDQKRFSGVINDHQQIIQALQFNDGTAAECIMAAHVHKSKLDLLSARARYSDKESVVPRIKARG